MFAFWHFRKYQEAVARSAVHVVFQVNQTFEAALLASFMEWVRYGVGNLSTECPLLTSSLCPAAITN